MRRRGKTRSEEDAKIASEPRAEKAGEARKGGERHVYLRDEGSAANDEIQRAGEMEVTWEKEQK